MSYYRDAAGNVIKIVEQKDPTEEEKAIKTNYCLTLSDCHYGAKFVSENKKKGRRK